MCETKKIKNKFLEEPREKLERLLVILSVAIGYYYVYFYQNMLHIEVELLNLNTLYQMPGIFLIVLPLIHYLIVKADPLQRSPSQRKSIRFFQNEFPSNYILERCERCIENEHTCKNYIKVESCAHIKYWFDDIFHGEIEKENLRIIKDTFEKSYTCKSLYYLTWILAVFCVLTIITMLFHHAYLYFFNEFRLDLSAFQVLFPITCVGVIILTKSINKPTDVPSGCWQAWREINKIHIFWLKSHENFLVSLICQASGGTKRFTIIDNK